MSNGVPILDLLLHIPGKWIAARSADDALTSRLLLHHSLTLPYSAQPLYVL